MRSHDDSNWTNRALTLVKRCYADLAAIRDALDLAPTIALDDRMVVEEAEAALDRLAALIEVAEIVTHWIGGVQSVRLKDLRSALERAGA
jgi:hypothetical protein